MPDTSTKTAIVTGATSGLGVSIAERLVADGFTVIATGRSVERGSALAERLGERLVFVQADLTDADAPARVAAAAVDATGRLDVLVNNAGIDHTGVLVDVPVDEIRDTFETNAVAAIRMAQEAARRMTDGGSIVNITSRLAVIGVPTMGVYSASKGALLAFTTAAAIEWAPQRIRVNSVAPGMARTPLYDEWLAGLDDPEAEEAKVTGAIPLGRLATGDDVAHAVSYLASDGASYVTGCSIPVDGGYTAK